VLRLTALLLFCGPSDCCENRSEMCNSSQHNSSGKCVILGFRREGGDSCALLGYYAARSGNFFPVYHVSFFGLSRLWTHYQWIYGF